MRRWGIYGLRASWVVFRAADLGLRARDDGGGGHSRFSNGVVSPAELPMLTGLIETGVAVVFEVQESFGADAPVSGKLVPGVYAGGASSSSRVEVEGAVCWWPSCEKLGYFIAF
ncbi:unnamed protein product [Discula destructiva]